MSAKNWQLQSPVTAISFDCDGTLTRIEGIDELAKQQGIYHEICTLTAKAMSTTGLNPALYQERLDLVLPNATHVSALGNRYFELRTPDVSAVIQILQRLNKTIYVLSAGLFPAVAQFAELLQISKENVYAVGIQFDAQGNYADFDRTSVLINNAGKRDIITQLKEKHERIIHIGDGLNDLVTHDLVTRFIGYGGVYFRDNIELASHYYIKTISLAPLLALALTHMEYLQLTSTEKTLFDQGVAAIEAGQVKT